MQEQELKDLLARIHNGTATDAERAFLETWYLQYQEQHPAEYSSAELVEDADAVWARLQPAIIPAKHSRLWPRIAVAASALAVLSVSAWLLLDRKNQPDQADRDVAPFSAMAILKTGGKIILLDSTANGKIEQTQVTKSSGEQLAYDATNGGFTAVYDTIEIPAGGRPYTVKLSDGTRITLNAATTLRYPEAFSKNRKEEIELISGEIYAEVTHNAAAPLQIKTPGQLITDIGTTFNITAYTDDPDARTTLIEGAVKVNAAGHETTLSPGSQAIFTGERLTESNADLTQATAWKDGLFRFNGESIDAIMRQISRWYNIEVKYEGTITNEVFYGRVARSRNISEVLRILERSDKVYFKIEGRRVTVLSK
ncbi:FecR family protein [Chitinophaga sp. YR627]|uniref:FecR family protein n=1 Tax=Chitinophaga sp. YR627 TaxID=1881041 RepID=UPI0008E72988|nr:FecR family protein [Chitinophaga sp. YR627]SFO52075.1 FecR family protein [Chitinophaga sp. YR627]